MNAPEIQSLSESDLPALKVFTDEQIGAGYYSEAELREIFAKSKASDTRMCSFLLKMGAEILGVRFTYPPGRWSHGKGQGQGLGGRGLHPEKWPHSLNETAYFQSLFLSAKVQGQGWGAKLSQASIDVLKTVGARGVVCHSWKESPFNSSSRYLEKMGFKIIAEHPLYWSEVNYNCSRCLKPPCQCTALEMYFDCET